MRAALPALVAAALLSAGCPAHLAPRPEEGPTTLEALRPIVAAYLASGPAQAHMEARASQYSDAGAMKGKLEVLLDRRRGFRMSGLSPTDDVVSTVACDAERFTAFERGAKVCWSGEACPGNVARFASLPMKPTDLAGVLLGRPPFDFGDGLEEAADPVALDWDGRAKAWTLTATAADTGDRHTLWVAPETGRVSRARVMDGDRQVADVRYSEFRRVGEAELPHRIDIALARDDTDLRIEVREVDLDVDFGESAFRFECPAGATAETLPCP
jgi:hypothetical protein